MLGLNPYQLRFVTMLIEAGAEFLVIGGQARHDINGDHDLDLWINVADRENAIALQRVIMAWLNEHPLHCSPGTAERVARGLPPNKMLSIPDARCAYLDDRQEMAIVGPGNGIDLLFGSLEGSAADYMARAVEREAAPGLLIPCMAWADATAIPRLEKFIERPPTT